MTDIWTVLAITTITGLATGLGAIPVFFRARVSHRIYDAALGLAAGMMIAASAFALVVPGLELGSLESVMGGVLIGGIGLLAANWLFPHVHAGYNRWVGHGGGPNKEPAAADALRRAILIGGAITIHNAPEGLAIGVAFASGLEGVGLAVAIVIGLQNIPDGFAFAVPMAETGLSRGKVLVYTMLSGAIPQIVAALAGFLLVEFVDGLFPLAAGFAAGAMIAVVFREMIPSSHGHGYADEATITFLAGFVLIVVVDTLLVV